MKKLFLILLLLSFAITAAAKKEESKPVYIDTPPHRKPYIATADKNRIYSTRNPIRRVDPEVKKYLEQKQKEADSSVF